MSFTVEPQTAITVADAYKFVTGTLPHVLNAGGLAVPQSAAAPQPVTSQAWGVAISVPRTADTNAYLAGDVIGTGVSSGNAVIDLGQLGPLAGGEVMFTTVALEIDKTAVPSGMTSFTLHLYSASPGSALADSAVWDLPSGDRASYLGAVELGTPVDKGSTLYVKTTQVSDQITAPAGHLYGYLVTNGAYTPASGDVHKITLHTAGL